MFNPNLLLGLLFSFVPFFIFGQTNDEKTEVQTDSVSYSVKGMTCGGCAGFVDGAANSVDGVMHCAVNLKAGRADIKYNPAKTNKQEIEKVLKSTGYAIAEIPENGQKKDKQNKKNKSEQP